jgi:hypothetical protein
MVVDDPPIDASIVVKPFLDKRREHVSADALFRPEDTEECFNREEGYVEGVPESLAEVINGHLRRRAAFQPKSDDAPQYVLEGTLVVLFGYQPSSSTARKGYLVGGIAGAALTASTTSGLIEIAFADLRIRNTRDGSVQRLPAVNYEYSGALPETGYCDLIYDNVDHHLKKVVEKLAPQIERAVRTWPGR